MSTIALMLRRASLLYLLGACVLAAFAREAQAEDVATGPSIIGQSEERVPQPNEPGARYLPINDLPHGRNRIEEGNPSHPTGTQQADEKEGPNWIVLIVVSAIISGVIGAMIEKSTKAGSRAARRVRRWARRGCRRVRGQKPWSTHSANRDWKHYVDD